MKNFLNEKEETFGFLNAAVTLCDNFPKLEHTNSLLTLSLSPFDFMINICITLGQYDKMLDWLVKMLTYTLPAIELSIKGILLSNLKNLMFCSVDPRIPNEFRMSLRDYENEDYLNASRGIFFNISDLDFQNLLDISPLTDYGKVKYFGTNNVITPYQFVRAEDLNSFLWLVYNKGYFPNPIPIKTIQDINPNAYGESVLHPIEVANVKESEGIVLGTTYKLENSTTVNVCSNELSTQTITGISLNDTTNKLQTNTTKTCTYTILPFSNNNLSVNWYVNRETYFDFLTPNKQHTRDYSKDIGLFNLSYIKETNVNVGKLHFLILPKPFTHLPCEGEPAWRIQRILFNADGEPDSKGNYTVKTNSTQRTVTKEEIIYNLEGKAELIINVKSGNYSLSTTDSDILPTILYECYRGFTVYEFNYDFVMGMKLYDAKTVAAQLIDSVTSLRLGFGLPRITHTVIETQQRIAETVRKIIESDGTEVSDCSFSFSNDEEEAMLEKTEERKAGGYNFNGSQNVFASIKPEEIINILNGISDTATLEENSEIIKHAFEQVTANVTEEVLGEERYNLECNIIKSLISSFVEILINALITPKVVLLFLINKQMAGDYSISINIEEFIKSIWNIIVGIIREIIDLILQELIELILSLIKPLLECITSQIIQEQIDAYRRLIELIITTCTFKRSSADEPSQLDTVVGADIYDNTSEIEQPQTSDCS